MSDLTFQPRETLHSPEAELAVIGAAMFDIESAADALEKVRPEHFGDPVAARIWRAVGGLAQTRQLASPHHVRDLLGLDEGFEAWGGFERLQEIDKAGRLFGLEQNVEAVLDRATRRGVRKLAQHVEAMAADTSRGSGLDVVAELERGAAEIAHQGAAIEHWRDPADMIERALENARNRGGVLEYPSGLAKLDEYTGGLHRGEVTLLGGRSGMGKTTSAQPYIKATAAAGMGVLVYSLEMGDDPSGLRLACDLAFDRHAISYSGETTNPTLDRALKGSLNDRQLQRMRETAACVRRWPLRYDTRPGLTMAQIEATARRQFRTWERQGIKPGLLVIDHLGKVRPAKERNGSRHNEVADVSNDSAEMAKRLNIPVLGLVQLNRQVEGRDDKRPMLSDLRQAGELEEDARQVIFIYRPEYYLRDGPHGETVEAEAKRAAKLRAALGKMYWIVEKNSHGPRGQVQTFCDMACSAVRDWD